MDEITVDSNEEVDFILDKCKGQCTEDDIIQIIDSYSSEGGGDPANHYKRIAEETNLSLEIIELVFDYQFEWLKQFDGKSLTVRHVIVTKGP